ncbi:hypothetical protein [Paenibacillus campi]|uniref:hypothetical protein n=1 Tax=Paenibacillus campi TaxID=3106031 RepID=UPI002AFF34C8|nr:hypothetical protein [Paenibacillus sp. SGZ-1009]
MQSNEPSLLTRQLLQHLNDCEWITDVKLVGSHTTGMSDRFSDIDLLLSIRHMNPATALWQTFESIQTSFSTLWHDFANSLMPDKFLVSLFIDGDNPFAFYDIGIMNDRAYSTYNCALFVNDPWVHLLKLWVMNFKYGMRHALQFERRYTVMMQKANLAYDPDYYAGFARLLNLLKQKPTVNEQYVHKLEMELKTNLNF